MSYRLHITGTAERDLTQAADYIEFILKNPSAADALLEEADRKINALLPFPKKHPLADDKLLSSWGIRAISTMIYTFSYNYIFHFNSAYTNSELKCGIDIRCQFCYI